MLDEYSPEHVRDALIIEHVIGSGYDPAWLLKSQHAEDEASNSRVKAGTWLAEHGWGLSKNGRLSWYHDGRNLHGLTTELALVRTAEWLVADILVEMGWARVDAAYKQGDPSYAKFIAPGCYRMRKGKAVCLPGAERHRIQYAARLAGMRIE